MSLLIDEKKSLPVFATIPDGELLVDTIVAGGDPASPLTNPFLAAASLAVFVKSLPKLLPTYVRSSNVFLLASAACSNLFPACLPASSAFFLACSVS